MTQDENRQFWNNHKKFEQPYDVPRLPIVDEKEWREFYIPKLIELGAVPKNLLKDKATYLGKCRNATEAIWDAKNNVFIYERHKFNAVFKDIINHFEDDNGFDLFVPIKEL